MRGAESSSGPHEGRLQAGPSCSAHATVALTPRWPLAQPRRRSTGFTGQRMRLARPTSEQARGHGHVPLAAGSLSHTAVCLHLQMLLGLLHKRACQQGLHVFNTRALFSHPQPTHIPWSSTHQAPSQPTSCTFPSCCPHARSLPETYLRGIRPDATKGSEFPIIAFINAKSGGRAGPSLARALKRAIGRNQVGVPLLRFFVSVLP